MHLFAVPSYLVASHPTSRPTPAQADCFFLNITASSVLSKWWDHRGGSSQQLLRLERTKRKAAERAPEGTRRATAPAPLRQRPSPLAPPPSRYGDANKFIRAIFTLASKLEPCIIFIGALPRAAPGCRHAPGLLTAAARQASPSPRCQHMPAHRS
jgi:hypothetical protein